MDYSIDDIPKISVSQLSKLILVGTHLHKWQGYGIEGLRSVFQQQGFVQIDPINPAGRYHDFFLFARIPDYKQGDLERILYQEGVVFENFFQMMCFIHRDYFPLFYSRRREQYLHKYYQKQVQYIREHHPTFFDDALSILRERGPQDSSILKELGEAAQGKSRWKEGIFKTNLFELLYHLGKTAIIGRQKNFAKVYDLVERKYSAAELRHQKFTEEQLFIKKIVLHQKSFPVEDSRISVTKIGNLKLSRARDARVRTQKQLKELINPSERNNHPSLVNLPKNNRIYIVPTDWKEKIKHSEYDGEMRAIGPLDPVIRDRNLTEHLFNFEYRWEIYTPKKKRRWGYYILPLLYKGKFVGRIEPSLKVKDNVLRFVNFYTEKNMIWTSSMVNALEDLLNRWKLMVNAVDMDTSAISVLN